MSNFDLRKFLAEGKLHEEMTSTEEAMDKPSKMKMSDLKKKIRQEILAELTLAEDVDIDTDGGEETEGKNDDNVSPVAEATKDGDGEVPSKDTDTDVDIIDKEEVEVDVEKKPKATGIDDDFLDQLEDLKDEADAMGDNKLERQIDNTITYFTRQHIAKDTNESIELEEDLTEAITADMIQKKYNEMFGKNPQTTFTDVAKALGTTEQEVAAVLFKLPMFEADELEEANDMDLVADLEAELTEGYSEFQRVDKGKKKTAARNKAEEEVYGAGVEKGEEIEKKKLQKESLEILKMKKLAGLITEGEYAKALLDEADNFTKAHAEIIKTYHNKKDPTSLDNLADGEDTRNLETYIDKSKSRDRQLFTDLLNLLKNEPNSERTKDAFSSFMGGFMSWMIANKKQLSSRSNNKSNPDLSTSYKSWNDYITSDENRGMF